MKKALMTLALFLLSGCLWITRVPFPDEQKFSDDGVRTNVVYRSALSKIQETGKFTGVYPLTQLRAYATYKSFKDRELTNLKGRELYEAKLTNRYGWIPGILIWLGEPVDFVVDTLMLPFDS